MATRVLAAAAALWLHVSAAGAASVTFGSTDPIRLAGGSDTGWFITNRWGTSNGRPTGGTAPAPMQPGLAVQDVVLGDGTHFDAFDGGNLVFVDGEQLVAPDTVDATAVATRIATVRGAL